MKIREYEPSDLAALKRMHAAQGFAYELPDIDRSPFLVRAVLEENGEPVMAALARMTTEVYLLADPKGAGPSERWKRLVVLHEVAMREGRRRGIEDAHCWVPPEIEKRFGRRLSMLGWRRVSWPCYWRETPLVAKAAEAN